MTIKEAFEMIHKAVKKSGMNPFFLIGNLNDTLKDIEGSVEEGSKVEVQQIQQTGVAVANIKVNGENNFIFAPQSTNSYSTEEHLVGYFYHDNISEDVYEKSYIINQTVANNGYIHFDSSIKNAKRGWVTGMCFSLSTNSNPINSFNGLIPDVSFTQSVGMAFENKVGRDINNIYLTIRYIKNS